MNSPFVCSSISLCEYIFVTVFVWTQTQRCQFLNSDFDLLCYAKFTTLSYKLVMYSLFSSAVWYINVVCDQSRWCRVQCFYIHTFVSLWSLSSLFKISHACAWRLETRWCFHKAVSSSICVCVSTTHKYTVLELYVRDHKCSQSKSTGAVFKRLKVSTNPLGTTGSEQLVPHSNKVNSCLWLAQMGFFAHPALKKKFKIKHNFNSTLRMVVEVPGPPQQKTH